MQSDADLVPNEICSILDLASLRKLYFIAILSAFYAQLLSETIVSPL